MLTETEAFALLEHYCGPLREGEWAHVDFGCESGWDDAPRGGTDFVLKAPNASSTRQARTLGARLRLALGVAQAVSYCDGFAPDVNVAFWRHAVATLWFSEMSVTPQRLALSRKSFSHVALQWVLESSADDTFWIGFFYGTPACDAVLTAVLHKLAPHLEVARLPPLHVALSYCGAGAEISRRRWRQKLDLPFGVDQQPLAEPHALWSTLRSAQLTHAATTWTDASTAAPTHLGLVLEYRVGSGASTTRHTLALLARHVPHDHLHLSIDRLAINLVPDRPPRAADPSKRIRRELASRGRPLGELLRAQLIVTNGRPRVRMVALGGCAYTDHRHVGATLSAVAFATPPVTELRCQWLVDDRQRQDHLVRLAWFVYALHRRRSVTSTPLALTMHSTGMAIDETERDYVVGLLARGTPLRDVVGEALRLRLGGDDDRVARLQQVECLRLGSTVRLVRGTALYFEPFRGMDTHDESVAATLDPAEEDESLDFVAQVSDGCAEFVGVVYAGYGLVWAPATSIVSWHRLDDDGDAVMTESDVVSIGESLTSLVLRFEVAYSDAPHNDSPSTPQVPALHVSPLLPLLTSGSLEKLELVGVVLSRYDLALVLDTSPRLASLSLLRCILESLDPLIDAYRCGRSSVSSLSLLSMRDQRFHEQRPIKHRLQALESSHMKPGDVPMWLAPFVDALVDGLARRSLRDMSIDIGAFESETERLGLLARLAHAVATNALPLRRLHIMDGTNRYESDMLPTLLGPLCGAVAWDPPRVRCAVLSVLRVFGCGTIHVARSVLALAEGGTRRLITWNTHCLYSREP